MPPLERIIREMIASEGPMRLDRYMAMCLGHAEHGYYMTRDPLGVQGDFITAPEVSQVFGELIGVWAIAAWTAMGAPGVFNLVELGPGRGTLMADMLRAASKVAPGFTGAARVHLVETSPVLRERQRATLGQAVVWHDRFEDVPEGPLLLVANEFFDALPLRQFERRDGAWHERVVGLQGDRLVLGLVPADIGSTGRDGDIIEWAPARSGVARLVGERLAREPGMALIIDYGHTRSAFGDTLQALKGHQPVSILESPGECDLTAHVDFEALARALVEGGAAVYPILNQRAFLLEMGLQQRTAILASRADPATRARLERQMTRLAGPDQMGNLFKVLAATSPGLPPPHPFAVR